MKWLFLPIAVATFPLWADHNINIQSFTPQTIGRSACDAANKDQFNFSIALSGGTTIGAGSSFTVEVFAAPRLQDPVAFCAPKPADSDIKLASVSISNTLVFNASEKITDRSVKKLLPANACAADGQKGEMALCVYVTHGGSTSYGGKLYQYDTTTTKITGFSGYREGHEQVGFSVQASGAIGSYQVCYGEDSTALTSQTGDCADPNETKNSSTPNIVVTGLENGTEYWFKVRLIDPSGTKSAWSDAFPLTPKMLVSAMAYYNGTPNPTSFSCNAQGGSSGSMIFALLGLLLMAIRPKKAGLLAIVLLAAIPAKAELGQVSLALLGSPYLPNIDAEMVGGQPIKPVYRCIFGRSPGDATGPWLPLMGLEADVHLTDAFGSLQLGVGARYALAQGFALTDANNCDSRSTDQNIGLHMFQLRPQLTYVFDPYVEIVPLAPYVRVGLIGHGYVFTFQGDVDRNANVVAQNPVGFRFGYEAAAGLLLMLDFIEPNTASRARASGVYDHTYLKAEFAYEAINNFHTPGFDFSPYGFGAPFPFLLTFGLVVEFL